MLRLVDVPLPTGAVAGFAIDIQDLEDVRIELARHMEVSERTIYRDVRRVATDGRPLSPPEDRWATAWGESVGHWVEGDTLVIETVAVRQPNLFFRAPPFSEAARYTERLRKVGPDRIEGEMTIEDPATLTAPWVVRQVYVRAEGVDRLVMDTFSNDRTIEEDGVFAILPPADE